MSISFVVWFFQIKVAFLFPDRLTPLDSGARTISSSILKYLRSCGIHITLITPFLWVQNTNSVHLYCDELIEIPSVLRSPWWRLLNRIFGIGRNHAFSRNILFRRLMRKRIWEALYGSNFDVIILNYIQFSEWIPDDLKHKTIVFTHDIYHRRWASLSQISLDHPSVTVVKNIEYNDLSKYPLLLTVADYEFEFLRKTFPLDKLCHIGAPQVVKRCIIDSPPYKFGFLGADASPNSDGLILFLQEWWYPFASSSLCIGGNICNNILVRQKVNSVGGTLLGFVDNLDEFYSNCQWILAPLYTGSGIKIKVLEAMARGKVVIGTRTAFEGIPVTHGVDALFLEEFSDPSMFYQMILTIENHPFKLTNMQNRSVQLIEQHFSPESCFDGFIKRINVGPPFSGGYS